MMRQIGVMLRSVRLLFLPVSLLPAIAAGAVAKTTGVFQPGIWAMAILGVVLLHAGANLWNDYHDDLNGTDRITYPTPFSGGSRVIQEKLLSAQTARTLSLVLIVLGMLLGIALCLSFAPNGLFFLAGGVMAALSYSAEPLRLSAKGWGEFVVGLAFGPLMTGGIYILMAKRLTFPPIIVGASLGLLVMAILCLNEIPDRIADALTGKENWTVRFGVEMTERMVGGLLSLAYFFIIFAVMCGVLPLRTMLVLLTLPWAILVVWKTRRVKVGDLSANRQLISLFFLFSTVLIGSLVWG